MNGAPRGRFQLGRNEGWLGGIVGLGLMAFGAYCFIGEGDTTVASPTLLVGAVFFGAGMVFRPIINRWLQGGGELGIGPAKGSLPSDLGESGEASILGTATQTPIPEEEPKALPAPEDAERDVEVHRTSARIEAMEGLRERDYERFDKATQQLIDGSEGEEKVRFESYQLYGLHVMGRDWAFPELLKMQERNPDSRYPLWYIARCLEESHDYVEAAKYFSRARRLKSLDSSTRLTALEEEVDALIKASRFDDALQSISEEADETRDSGAQARIEKLLGDAYRASKQHEDADQHYETCLSLNPGDTSTRFALAYNYSERGLSHLAIYHYDILASVHKNAVALNNLAVDLWKLLPIMAVRFFKAATEADVSLAASNLADHLGDIGFVDDAREWLRKGEGMPSVHARVKTVAGRIADRESEEPDAFKSMMEEFRALRELYIRRLKARGEQPQANAEAIVSEWDTTVGALTFSREDREFAAAFKEGIWDWGFKGRLEGLSLVFAWKNDVLVKDNKGEGFLIFSADLQHFDGVFLDTPERGRLKLFSGDR